jgi:hypothetical protein
MTTIPAPSTSQQSRTPSAIAFTHFGTIGYDLYLAVVLAEEARRAAVVMKGIGR